MIYPYSVVDSYILYACVTTLNQKSSLNKVYTITILLKQPFLYVDETNNNNGEHGDLDTAIEMVSNNS